MVINVITVFQRLEEDERGYLSTGASRVWGYYHDLDTAIQAVKDNVTDMWEFLYDYALIEKMDEGVPAECMGRMFFKFDRESMSYYEIPEPECCHGIVNFSMG